MMPECRDYEWRTMIEEARGNFEEDLATDEVFCLSLV
jgi:hypothetical protein